jgi:small subunit ribosomal protein S16
VAVKIRLMRVGKKKQPTYRVVVADGRSPRDGRFIEIIGQYAPREEPSGVEINAESALAWLRKGAQPTEQVQKLLAATGVWAQYEEERGKPAVTKLSRRGYLTGKVAPGVKTAKDEPKAEAAPAPVASAPAAAAPAAAAPAASAPVEEAALGVEAEEAPAPEAAAEPEPPAEDAPAEDAPAEDTE